MANHATKTKTCPCGTTFTPHRAAQTHCGHCTGSIVQQIWNSSVRMASRREERALHDAWERRERFAAARATGRW